MNWEEKKAELEKQLAEKQAEIARMQREEAELKEQIKGDPYEYFMKRADEIKNDYPEGDYEFCDKHEILNGLRWLFTRIGRKDVAEKIAMFL